MYFTHHSPDSSPFVLDKGEPLMSSDQKGEQEQHQKSNNSAVSFHRNTSTDFSKKGTNNGRSSISSASVKVLSLTEEQYEDFSSSYTAITRAAAAISVYLIIGTLVFGSWVEEWNAIDAMYYTVATFTTVGYGDLYPQTNGQRFFGMFFVTAGIMILGGIALGIVFDAVFTMMEESTDASKKDMEKKFFDKFAETKDPCEYKVHISSKASSSGESGEKRNWIMKVMMNGCLIAMIFIPGLLIGYFEGWSVLESFYFCIVTATTVGYGDLSPQTNWTRLAAVIYLPFCVTIMAQFFSQITGAYMDRKAKESEKRFLSRKLTLQDIEEIDSEGNGTVNPVEFLEFMLVAMGKVDVASIEAIKALFEKLDVKNDGLLDSKDIIAMAYGDESVRNTRANVGYV